jgi:hypothetical protein
MEILKLVKPSAMSMRAGVEDSCQWLVSDLEVSIFLL